MVLSKYGFTSTTKGGDGSNEPRNYQQSDESAVVTPNRQGLYQRVITNTSRDVALELPTGMPPNDAAIQAEEAEDGAGDETDLQLTPEELEVFTQQWNPFDENEDYDGDAEDDDDTALDLPAPRSFSQSSASHTILLTQLSADSEDVVEEPIMGRAPKRFRLDINNEQEHFPVIHREPQDTDDTWNLVDSGTWKIFKKEEQFCVAPTIGPPKLVYTIKSFFNDSKIGKMAICHVAIRAKETFLGKDNPDFDEKKFEEKFGSMYVSCRTSQHKPLRKLRIKLNHGDVDFKKVSDLKVHYDHPEADIKGCGWTIGFSFDEIFPIEVLKPLNAIDMFAGGGGMSCGLEIAGFKVSHAVDNDPISVATLRHNHPVTKVFCQEVDSFVDEAIKSRKTKGPYNCSKVVHGHFSSPCQGFSRMNTTGSETSREKNNELCLSFPKGVIGLELPTGSFENVTGMLDPKNVHYVQKIAFMFLLADYQVRVGVVDSSRYGDPQKRERLIILVSKYGWALPNFPEPTYGPGTMNPLRTPRDAIGDLEQIEPRASPGYLMLEKPWRGMFVNESAPSTYVALEVDHHVRSHDGDHPSQKEYAESDKLKADKPANTVLCGHAIKHYSLDRALTNLEAARLQSFPDHWKFAGSAKQVLKQIGNAVPIGLATAIAKEIYKVYETGEQV